MIVTYMKVKVETVGGIVYLTKFSVQISVPNHWWNLQFILWGKDENGRNERTIKYIKIMPHFVCKFLASHWG